MPRFYGAELHVRLAQSRERLQFAYALREIAKNPNPKEIAELADKYEKQSAELAEV